MNIIISVEKFKTLKLHTIIVILSILLFTQLFFIFGDIFTSKISPDLKASDKTAIELNQKRNLCLLRMLKIKEGIETYYNQKAVYPDKLKDIKPLVNVKTTEPVENKDFTYMVEGDKCYVICPNPDMYGFSKFIYITDGRIVAY